MRDGGQVQRSLNHLVIGRHWQAAEVHRDQGGGAEVGVVVAHLTAPHEEQVVVALADLCIAAVEEGVLGHGRVQVAGEGVVLLNRHRGVRAVEFFTNVVGQVEERSVSSRTKHAVVDRLHHPQDVPREIKVAAGREGAVGDVEHRGIEPRVVDVEAGHVVGRILLDEHPPIGNGAAASVGPAHRRLSVGSKGVGGGVPNDGVGCWCAVHSRRGGAGHLAVFPGHVDVGALCCSAFK